MRESFSPIFDGNGWHPKLARTPTLAAPQPLMVSESFFHQNTSICLLYWTLLKRYSAVRYPEASLRTPTCHFSVNFKHQVPFYIFLSFPYAHFCIVTIVHTKRTSKPKKNIRKSYSAAFTVRSKFLAESALEKQKNISTRKQEEIYH